MIKLQLLLRHPALDLRLGEALRAELERLGIHVTACGRVTVSANIAPADFDALFHAQPPAAVIPAAAPELPIPRSLTDSITLITVAPHHVPTAPTGKGPHAAI